MFNREIRKNWQRKHIDSKSKKRANQMMRTQRNIEKAPKHSDTTIYTSVARLAQELSVSSSSTYRIQMQNIEKFSYKIQMFH